MVEGYYVRLVGRGNTARPQSNIFNEERRSKIAERISRGSSEMDHRVGSGVSDRGRCRGSSGQSSLRALILRPPPTNNPDKRVDSKLEEGRHRRPGA